MNIFIAPIYRDNHCNNHLWCLLLYVLNSDLDLLTKVKFDITASKPQELISIAASLTLKFRVSIGLIRICYK